jgi:hypothetical protein
MRLIHRHRHHSRGKAPQIAISQAEITADLHYPAGRPGAQSVAGAETRRSPTR